MSRLLLLAALIGALLAFAPGASASTSEFVTPLFGLTEGKGGLLVSDAGQGIVRIQGGEADLFAPLPGVSDVDPSEQRELWAITSGGEENSRVWLVTRRNQMPVADLFAFEEEHNPHPATVESNPFDIEKLGHRAIVADAAGNDLILARRDGGLRLVAILPDERVPTSNAKQLAGCPTPSEPELEEICELPRRIPAEPVATSVVVAPDAFYVGELKGFPAPRNQSRIWRIDRDARGVNCAKSRKCQVVVDGRTSIIDLAWHDGALYAAQIDDASWFALELGQPAGGSVWACKPLTGACEMVVGRQPILTAITVRENGSIWGVINALIPPLADVVRLRGPQ